MAIKATLVYGADYFLGDLHFTTGKAIEVTEDQKAHLVEFAIDPLTVWDGEVAEASSRQKFIFEGEADEPKRTRTRKPASEDVVADPAPAVVEAPAADKA
jgi:hypothetical protein